MQLQKVASAEIARVHAAYKGKSGRNELTNLAVRIGNIPEVRRMVCHFADKALYPERPIIKLHNDYPSIYLLGWREGDWTDIHDHGNCEVGIYIVQGQVIEDLYATEPDEGEDRRQLLAFSRVLRQGDVATCPVKYIHAIGNIFPEVAATLHVYGPALDDMHLFRLEAGKLKFETHWHDSHRPQH